MDARIVVRACQSPAFHPGLEESARKFLTESGSHGFIERKLYVDTPSMVTAPLPRPVGTNNPLTREIVTAGIPAPESSSDDLVMPRITGRPSAAWRSSERHRRRCRRISNSEHKRRAGKRSDRGAPRRRPAYRTSSRHHRGPSHTDHSSSNNVIAIIFSPSRRRDRRR
jgi:hypothetical protein